MAYKHLPAKCLLGLGLIIGFSVQSAAPIYAQDNNPPSRQALSLAAGYKAMFTCSAVFNGGKALDDIAVDELKHIYPGYEPLLDDVGEAVIDRKAKTVAVNLWAAHRQFLS